MKISIGTLALLFFSFGLHAEPLVHPSSLMGALRGLGAHLGPASVEASGSFGFTSLSTLRDQGLPISSVDESIGVRIQIHELSFNIVIPFRGPMEVGLRDEEGVELLLGEGIYGFQFQGRLEPAENLDFVQGEVTLEAFGSHGPRPFVVALKDSQGVFELYRLNQTKVRMKGAFSQDEVELEGLTQLEKNMGHSKWQKQGLLVKLKFKPSSEDVGTFSLEFTDDL